jgi:hypothetical protein
MCVCLRACVVLLMGLCRTSTCKEAANWLPVGLAFKKYYSFQYTREKRYFIHKYYFYSELTHKFPFSNILFKGTNLHVLHHTALQNWWCKRRYADDCWHIHQQLPKFSCSSHIIAQYLFVVVMHWANFIFTELVVCHVNLMVLLVWFWTLKTCLWGLARWRRLLWLGPLSCDS